MPVNTNHPDYDLYLPAWSRARDVLAGEDAVKTAGERYLRRIRDHDLEDYEAYKDRASFYNATARTAAGYIGMIFRRAPFIKVPDAPAISVFTTDADLLGTTFYGYSKQIVTEVVHVGRAGTLVDWQPNAERPYASLYRAEDMVNWRAQRVHGRIVPTLIVLAERADALSKDDFVVQPLDQRRVLKLVPDGQDFRVEIEIWREMPRPGLKPEWRLAERHTPLRRGEPLRQIPFVFHGPRHCRPAIDRPPLDDLIAINLDHYRLDADYKHGIHFTALPTAWVVGFDPARELRIGSAFAWMSNDTNARAGYLEYHGQGLESFERALDRDERLMALLGSRLLEGQKRVAETAEALAIRQAGEESILANIATSLSESITQILRWVHWWSSPDLAPEIPPDAIGENEILFELNTDFGITGLTARDLQAVVAAWQAGAFSHDTLLELFRKGEILPDARTNEEELRLLASEKRTASGAKEDDMA
jgi:hypothetical protein